MDSMILEGITKYYYESIFLIFIVMFLTQVPKTVVKRLLTYYFKEDLSEKWKDFIFTMLPFFFGVLIALIVKDLYPNYGWQIRFLYGIFAGGASFGVYRVYKYLLKKLNHKPPPQDLPPPEDL
jgi:hypothetical protein